MNEFFLTDPGNQSDDVILKTKKPSGNRSIRYKENVCAALQTLGIPKGTAEIAVIDMRGTVIACMHQKHTPYEAASLLLNPVTKMYHTDGKWHYL